MAPIIVDSADADNSGARPVPIRKDLTIPYPSMVEIARGAPSPRPIEFRGLRPRRVGLNPRS
jgi:hypothetical protein